MIWIPASRISSSSCQLQGSPAASKQFLEHLIKFPADLLKFLLKLTAHSCIQFFDDLYQRGLCLHQVIVLSFHEIHTVQKLLCSLLWH